MCGARKRFSHFQGKSLRPEFDPYVLLLMSSASCLPRLQISANPQSYAHEYFAIAELLNLVLETAECEEQRQSIAIGVFNCLFWASPDAEFNERLFYLWCHLVHLSVSHLTDGELKTLSQEVNELKARHNS